MTNQINKERRNAGRRIVHEPHQRMRPRAKRRALASRRSTTALAAATERHRSAPANALPGWSSQDRALPDPCHPQCSGLPRRPVVVPAGRITPEPPGSGGDEPPPAGTALAPPPGVTGWRLSLSEMIRIRCSQYRDECQEVVSAMATILPSRARSSRKSNYFSRHRNMA
jgi:hypothetical protein